MSNILDSAKKMRVRLTFTEEILGTASNNKRIHSEYIASKSPNAKSREEEVAAVGVDETIEKEMTVFPRDAMSRPFIWDYQIKGFFKNAAKAYNSVSKLTSYKTKIDNLVFIKERRIILQIPKGTGIGNCQRPLRASTAQGERVALANSESAPAGTVVEFTIMVLDKSLMDHVINWLDYGALNGIGQWHNSGKGRFEWEELPLGKENNG